MAEKARQLAKSNYGLSFTGVAGDPIEGQPTGTVWIGLAEEANQPLQNVSILTVTEIILDRVRLCEG